MQQTHTYGIRYIHPKHGLLLVFETGTSQGDAEKKFNNKHRKNKAVKSFDPTGKRNRA